MNQITESPEPKDFGYSFDYSTWTAGTQVTLCNVPWSSDYRDVVRFANQGALNTYINNLPSNSNLPIQNLTYCNPGEPVRIQLPHHVALKFNYLRVYNPAQPVAGDSPKFYYYFINGVQRLAPNTTELSLQMDVWQTFGYDATFGNCYIERGHIGIANENSFADYGREYLTTPEGLDIGGEYVIEKQWIRDVGNASDDENDDANGTYEIMVISSVDLSGNDHGTIDEPKLKSATGSRWENLPNGASIYIFNGVQFKKFLTEFSDKPWVTQGILSIMAIPYAGAYWSYTDTDSVAIGATASANVPHSKSLDRRKQVVALNWRDNVELGRYSNLKKMLTYPYSVLELTSYTGTPLMLKPESWNDPDATVMELPHFAPPNARLAFYPFRYNAGGAPVVTDDMGVLNDGGEFLDMQTGIFNFPTFSILNNGYLSYMAANANTIAYQHSSADWGQQRSMTGAMNAYNQANSGMGLNRESTKVGINQQNRATTLANETAGYQALVTGASGVSNAIVNAKTLGGGAAGAVTSALTTGASAAAGWMIATNQNNQSNSINTTAAQQQSNASLKNSAFLRDSNRDYAEFAAKGDYENQIAGIQAKTQDARLIQPTTSGQVGGDAFLLAVYKWGYDLKLKMMGGQAMRNVGEYWLRYGYQINTFGRMPANFMVMENFTYWKLRETYITAAGMPELFKQTLRGIFEKGVTVWSDPAKIGNIDIADNEPLEGITL